MSKALAIISNETAVLTDRDIEVLRKSKFKGFSDDEMSYAARVCRQLSLSPFLNQIHFIKRGSAVTTQVGIDGLRLAAQRAGGYAGSDDGVFEMNEGSKIPVKATVTVYKMVEGVRCSFTASAMWSEYCPGAGQDHMWKKMPQTMLAKCAEAKALRKAFPAELAGIYSNEEMQQADPVPSKAKILNERLEGRIAPEPEPQVEVLEAEAVERSPGEDGLGDFIVPFGHLKGKRHDECDDKKIQSAVKWARDNGKYLDWADRADEYLARNMK